MPLPVPPTPQVFLDLVNPEITTLDVQRHLVANPDVRNPMGLTVLMVAAKLGLVEHVAALVRMPEVDSLSTDPQGKTALWWAVGTDQTPGVSSTSTGVRADRALACVRALVTAGPLAARMAHDGVTPLMQAASFSDACVEQVQALLPHSDPNAVDDRGRTALMLAAENGWVDNLRCLLAVSDPSLQDQRGRTALHWAAASSSTETLQALFTVSDPNSPDHQGETPVFHVLGSHHKTSVMQGMLDLLIPISNMDHLDRLGCSVLTRAVVSNQGALVPTLIRATSEVGRHRTEQTLQTLGMTSIRDRDSRRAFQEAWRTVVAEEHTDLLRVAHETDDGRPTQTLRQRL